MTPWRFFGRQPQLPLGEILENQEVQAIAMVLAGHLLKRPGRQGRFGRKAGGMNGAGRCQPKYQQQEKCAEQVSPPICRQPAGEIV